MHLFRQAGTIRLRFIFLNCLIVNITQCLHQLKKYTLYSVLHMTNKCDPNKLLFYYIEFSPPPIKQTILTFALILISYSDFLSLEQKIFSMDYFLSHTL